MYAACPQRWAVACITADVGICAAPSEFSQTTLSSTLGSQKLPHRGRNMLSSYARFEYIFICTKILVWMLNKSVDKMNSTLVLTWLRESNLLAKSWLSYYYIIFYHIMKKLVSKNTHYLNHNCNIWWFIPLWLLEIM